MIELFVFDRNTCNPLTVCKQMSSSSFLKSYLQTIHLQTIYHIYIYIYIIYKQDLALDNLLGSYAIKPNQPSKKADDCTLSNIVYFQFLFRFISLEKNKTIKNLKFFV